MITTVNLVLASTCKFPSGVDNVFTFRFSYETPSLWRYLLGRPKKTNVVFATGRTAYEVYSDLSYDDINAFTASMFGAIADNFKTARAAFTAVHDNGRLSVNVTKEAMHLWGSRVNDVLKFRKVGEYHIPKWDGVFLSDHIAEAQLTRWKRTKENY